MEDHAIPLDILTRIIKVVRGGVYSIILAESEYAIPNTAKGVKLLETYTNREATGFLTATLLESSSNAGADFANITITAEPGEAVTCIVVPKSTEARANWIGWYVLPLGGYGEGETRDEIPANPFLWMLKSMGLVNARPISFKIRYAPHIQGPEGPQGPMAQMYPSTAADANQSGWCVLAYRTDKKGTGQMFTAPPEWLTDVISVGFVDHPNGLLFGKDPPLIAADIPI